MFYKKRDKKAEPALGAASENDVAAALENGFDAPVKSKFYRINSFRLLSAITCTFCGLLWVALFLSSFWLDLFVIHLKPVFFSISLFLVMSVIFAVKLQPAKQGLSAFLYLISCVSLLYIGFAIFLLIPLLALLCVQAVLLEIITAVLGRKEKDAQFSGKKVLRIAAVFLTLSVFIFAGESLLYHRHTSELSKATLNGVALTKEQWDCIDEDYFLRCGIQNRLIPEGLGVLGYRKELVLYPSRLNGELYTQYRFPPCKGLQPKIAILSVTKNRVGTYSVLYGPVSPDDEKLKNYLDAISVVIGDNYICEGKVYTSEEILSLAAPDKANLTYKNRLEASSEMETIFIELTVEENGYISVSALYAFPGAYVTER
jgi:hypothetical protein